MRRAAFALGVALGLWLAADFARGAHRDGDVTILLRPPCGGSSGCRSGGRAWGRITRRGPQWCSSGGRSGRTICWHCRIWLDYYGLIHKASATPFAVERVAALELEWWIVHRQRDRHAPGDLERALAELQAAIYSRPLRTSSSSTFSGGGDADAGRRRGSGPGCGVAGPVVGGAARRGSSGGVRLAPTRAPLPLTNGNVDSPALLTHTSHVSPCSELSQIPWSYPFSA